MTEDELTAKVIRECWRHGTLVHHCKDSRHCQGTPGIPDLIILSPKGMLLAELKSADGQTSADQDLWLYNLHMVSEKAYALGGWYTVSYRLWRPQDWEEGTIQETLRKMAFRAGDRI